MGYFPKFSLIVFLEFNSLFSADILYDNGFRRLDKFPRLIAITMYCSNAVFQCITDYYIAYICVHKKGCRQLR